VQQKIAVKSYTVGVKNAYPKLNDEILLLTKKNRSFEFCKAETSDRLRNSAEYIIALCCWIKRWIE